MDKQNTFSDEQAITSSTASTNVIDVGENAGAGTQVRIMARVIQAFASGGGVSMTAALEDSDDGVSFSTVKETADFADTELTGGKDLAIGSLPNNHRRYVRIYYTVSGGSMTAGTVTAGLVLDEQTNA